MRTVGVIGGLGPETTANFYNDLIYLCQEKYKEVRPRIIISSLPVTYDMGEDLILNNKGIERYLPYMIEEAQRLEKAGCDFLVIPCNSVHVYIDEVRESVSIPVLSILEETAKFLIKNKIRKTGIVSTTSTIDNKLYDSILEENNILFKTPSFEDQKILESIVMNTTYGEKTTEDRANLIKVINDFEDVDSVLLACTDFQLLKPLQANVHVFDTMNVLAIATADEIFKK